MLPENNLHWLPQPTKFTTIHVLCFVQQFNVKFLKTYHPISLIFDNCLLYVSPCMIDIPWPHPHPCHFVLFEWSVSIKSIEVFKCDGIYINTLRLRRNGQYCPGEIFKCIFLNENIWISIHISLKFVPKGQIDNIPALVQMMAWRRSGDKPLCEPMVVSLLTHICVTQPQWVNRMLVLLSIWLDWPYPQYGGR